ncbi:hypothetical protein KJZ63_03490 [Patescibacteria group bacterium]|nr:hypothetical protein [Patescibacteria group bacterium]
MQSGEVVEKINSQKVAFDLAKKVLADPDKLEAVRAGVARYTNNVDVEFRGVDTVLTSESTQIFNENRGVAYMLWGAFDSMARQGKIINLDNMSNEDLSKLVYDAYINAGASGG